MIDFELAFRYANLHFDTQMKNLQCFGRLPETFRKVAA